MESCNDSFTIFSKNYNLFKRFKIDETMISDLDIILTKLYLIIMFIVPIYIIIYKIDHYEEDLHYCENHKNVHSCRNVTFPLCIIDIIVNIFAIKLFFESIFSKITNTVRFFYTNSVKVIDYIDDEFDDAFDNAFDNAFDDKDTVKPYKKTEVEIISLK